MPLTPFAGLSVIIHLLIILVSAVLHKSFLERLKSHVHCVSNNTLLIVSLSIMTVIFSITLVIASRMIYLSTHDEYSSFRYMQALIRSYEMRRDADTQLMIYVIQ